MSDDDKVLSIEEKKKLIEEEELMAQFENDPRHSVFLRIIEKTVVAKLESLKEKPIKKAGFLDSFFNAPGDK